MSKVEQTKAAQGYIEKPVHPMCSNCSSYSLNLISKRDGYEYLCSLGNFKVNHYSTCDKHEFKTT